MRVAKRRAVCPGCSREMSLTKAGKLHTHGGDGPGGRCAWSKCRPDAADPRALSKHHTALKHLVRDASDSVLRLQLALTDAIHRRDKLAAELVTSERHL